MANIITRPTREALIRGPRIGLQGLIGWELIHSRTGLVVASSGVEKDGSTKLHPNLITNVGLNAIGTGAGTNTDTQLSNLINHCAVGTDNTAPAVTQTALGNQVGTRVTSTGGFASSNGVGDANAYAWRRFYRVFLEDNANGNLTEVGYFNAATDGLMFNRQLLKDDLGNPTTIVKTSEHQLRVILEYRLYGMIDSDTEVGVVIGGSPYDVSTRQISYSGLPDGFGAWSAGISGSPSGATPKARAWESNTLPGFGSVFSGSASVGSAHSLQGYTDATHYRDAIFTWEPSVGNFATGVGGIAWSFINAGLFVSTEFFASAFVPKIPKADIHRLRLTTRMSWARV